jgi:hemolysin activation/secretion protein
LKLPLITFALLSVSQAALAQQQPVGAGGQLQQIPPAPTMERSIPELRVERHGPSADMGPAGARITVQSLHVAGATRYSQAQLIAVTGFRPGSALDLRDLRGLAARITDFYNRQGYFVAQAYLAAQDVSDGAVTITVVEGRYGQVALNNHTRLHDGVANRILAGLDSGDVVRTPPLERRLLLLSDIPGVDVRSTLTPGASVGTSDLIVALTPGPLVSGSLEADNEGNRYTGEGRVGGVINLNNPLGLGDVASVRVLSSLSGLNYVRGAYQLQVQDATVGAAYSSLDYRLGREFKDLHASGVAGIASVFASYPLVRGYNTNLTVLGDVDFKTFRDKVGSTDSTTDKTATVFIAGLNGDHRDGFFGGGASAYSLTGSFGDLDIRTASARAEDAATARTEGDYYKLGFSLSRSQNVIGPLSLYGLVRGQVASKNLDISEKMELGGAYAVRAYPEGDAYGDEGYVLSLEAHVLAPRWWSAIPGRFQAYGFFDNGQVTESRNPWMGGSNHASRSGAGLGLAWADNNNFVAKVFYAHKIGAAVADSEPDKPGRLWVQVAKLF